MRQEVVTGDKDIVLALRRALAARIGRERYDLWFGSAVRPQLVGRRLRVAAPDQFTLERLRKTFRGELQAVCEELLRAPVEVEFYVEPSPSRRETAPDPRPDAPASSPTNASGAGSGPPRSARRGAHEPDGSRRPLARLSGFVVGDGNRLAHTAATMVTARPGVASPLFLYGPTGVGKTHLLEGIWTAVRQTARLRRLVFLSAEQFTTYFLDALHGSGLPSFRRKHRQVDLLMIDDVQFFVGKRATVVELQHTIDTLLREGRQLVLASDRPPPELAGLGAELVARMSGGLVCAIEQPDRETRLGILRRLAAARGAVLPEDVLDFVAAELDGDARQLAGALNRLEATGKALQQPLTLELAQTALADIIRATQRVVRLADIERAVCDVFGLEPRVLQSGRKTRAVSHPRMLAMWLARKHTRAAFSEIGRYFGNRTHSTVISAEKKVDRWMANKAPIQFAHGSCDVAAAVRRVEVLLRTG